MAASIEHKQAFEGADYKTIVDIGANVGQFALFARERFPSAKIFSFEPLDDCWDIFKRLFQSSDNVRLYPYAVAANDGEASLNVTTAKDSSSILAPSATQVEVFGTAIEHTKKIEVRRLGSVLRNEDITGPALLKIDVQGFELDVLQGCEELLSLFDAVYVEASYLELYCGQALVTDVIEFLRKHDFDVRGVFNQHIDPSRGPLQADFLFQRRRKTDPANQPG
ncbi:FkbM family methyltransferase [Bradyrhizobium genomosp. III]|uniref:FkbM family methyltransferase n=1 Tax=Bradyrhizobium genomosp. III TaxID=2683271 RepID=UPI000688AEFC|nr:FkbM family methyltransferase [Bradyrhizobium sp. CCBAU 15635]